MNNFTFVPARKDPFCMELGTDVHFLLTLGQHFSMCGTGAIKDTKVPFKGTVNLHTFQQSHCKLLPMAVIFILN